MKIYKKLVTALFIFASFFLFAANTRAMTPTLSLSPQGNGDNVFISVTGDTNSAVILYFNLSSTTQSRVLGSTNSNGLFSMTISASNYGITPGGLVYVTVNNQQSLSITWPFSSFSSSLSLSQTNISLSQGQSSTVFATNGASSLFVSNNSNSSVASVTVSGSSVTIFANNFGNTTITVCQSGLSSACGTIFVNVGGSGFSGNSNSVLNISNLTLPAGSSATISSSNSNSLYVSNNSNPGVVSINSSGSINGCTSGALYSITTGAPCFGNSGFNNGNNSNIPGCFGANQFSITTGQPCFGNSGFNNGNNGSVVISAVSFGSSTVTICQNGGGSCSTIFVTVTGFNFASPIVSQNGEVPTIYSQSSAQ